MMQNIKEEFNKEISSMKNSVESFITNKIKWKSDY
jgi:hypothetical protein